jgi:hypothetical protein
MNTRDFLYGQAAARDRVIIRESMARTDRNFIFAVGWKLFAMISIVALLYAHHLEQLSKLVPPT